MFGAFGQQGQAQVRPRCMRTALHPTYQLRSLPFFLPVYLTVAVTFLNWLVCARAWDKETERG